MGQINPGSSSMVWGKAQVSLPLKRVYEADRVVHTCNPSTVEVETGGLPSLNSAKVT